MKHVSRSEIARIAYLITFFWYLAVFSQLLYVSLNEDRQWDFLEMTLLTGIPNVICYVFSRLLVDATSEYHIEQEVMSMMLAEQLKNSDPEKLRDDLIAAIRKRNSQREQTPTN